MWVIKLSLGSHGIFYFVEASEWIDTIDGAREFDTWDAAQEQVEAMEADELSNVTIERVP